MHGDYVPKREAVLRTWLGNMAGRITLTPAAFGLSVPEALQLSTATEAFEAAYLAAHTPATRTHSAIVLKNTCKAAVITVVRALIRKVQATSTVTDQQKSDLQIPLHDLTPSPVPTPDTQPVVSVVYAGGNKLWVRVTDIAAAPKSRAKPFCAAGCEVFAFVGEAPPEQLVGWEPKGLFSRTSFEIGFAPSDAGKKITLIARWYNSKGACGEFSQPVVSRITGGAVEAA